MSYRPEIDGLRAVAVIPVVLFHAGLGFSGGFVGVDVFFVISGYLITGLILKDLSAGKFSLAHFWERRVRRILPAMTVVVLATLLAGYFLFLPWDFEELGRSVIAQSFLGANFHFWAESGYFDGPAELKPLLHTWSLAVEEQFYLLFPGFLLLLWRRLWSHAQTTLVVLWIASFLLSVLGVYYFPDATFYLLPGRAWELLTGALLAYWKPSGADSKIMPVWSRECAAFTGLGLIIFAYFSFDGATRFPGPAALMPCLGTGLFLWANEGKLTQAGKILALKPVVFIGLVSYSWYLWHWPAFAYLNRIYLGEIGLAHSLAVVLGSFLLAVLSWRYVETPFRIRRICASRASVFKAGLAAFASCVALGLFLDATDGLPRRVPEAVIRMSEMERNPKFRKKNVLEDALEGKFQPMGVEAQEGNTPTFVLWGDSHAIALAPVIDAMAKEYGFSGYAALRPGTPPLAGVWIDKDNTGRQAIVFNQAVIDFIKKEKIDRVLLVARWSMYHSGKGDGTLNGLILSDKETETSFEAAARAFSESVPATVGAIRNAGAEVFILEQVPDQRFDVPRELADRIWRGMPVEELGIDRSVHDDWQRPVHDVFEGLGSAVTLLDPGDMLFNESGRTRLIKDGQSLYIDEDHVSDAGAEYLRPLLKAFFVRSNSVADTP